MFCLVEYILIPFRMRCAVTGGREVNVDVNLEGRLLTKLIWRQNLVNLHFFYFQVKGVITVTHKLVFSYGMFIYNIFNWWFEVHKTFYSCSLETLNCCQNNIPQVSCYKCLRLLWMPQLMVQTGHCDTHINFYRILVKLKLFYQQEKN